MPAYLKQAPSGVAGDITRTDESNTEPIMLVGVGSPAVYPSAFGVPLKYVAGGAQQINGGSDTAASFAGILVRNAPSISGSSADDAGYGGTPLPTEPQDMLVRGYCSVVCVAGTPARGGVVYMQVTSSGTYPIGSFQAVGTDGGNAVALSATQAEWASDGVGSDGAGNTNIAEIRVAR